jgi:hypothetical protein
MFSRAWLQEVCSCWVQETSRESERHATAPSVSAAGAGQRRPGCLRQPPAFCRACRAHHPEGWRAPGLRRTARADIGGHR